MWPRIFIGITRTPENAFLVCIMTVHSKIDVVDFLIFTLLGLLCSEKLEQLCCCFVQMEIQLSVTVAQQTVHS